MEPEDGPKLEANASEDREGGGTCEEEAEDSQQQGQPWRFPSLNLRGWQSPWTRF